MAKLAIIRVRGLCKVRSDISEAMDLLGLQKKHTCVIVEESPSVKGTLQKIKDFVTFGNVSEESLKLLEEKRSSAAVKNDYKAVYFLAPPKGGFERKGIKKPFNIGGALGARAEKINDLIAKMV